jgi:predicted nucleic acid-binding protein
VREATADTGPFIHLDEVHAGRALAIFARVLVPHAVAMELRSRPRLGGSGLLDLPNVGIVRMTEPERVHARRICQSLNLSVADAHALAVARSRGAVLLTDDLDLRDAAAMLEVTAVGTIGVLVRACTTGVMTRTQTLEAMDALLASSSLFITRPLLERAKRALHEMD